MTTDRQRHIAVNFRGFKDTLATSIMRAMPLGFLPAPAVFDEWMETFTEAYPRQKHKHDPRKAGSKVGWLHNRETFTLERPTET